MCRNRVRHGIPEGLTRGNSWESAAHGIIPSASFQARNQLQAIIMEAELLQVWMERHWDKVFKVSPGAEGRRENCGYSTGYSSNGGCVGYTVCCGNTGLL
jgi:hypothetical protein